MSNVESSVFYLDRCGIGLTTVKLNIHLVKPNKREPIAHIALNTLHRENFIHPTYPVMAELVGTYSNASLFLSALDSTLIYILSK